MSSALRNRALRELGLPRWRARLQDHHTAEGMKDIIGAQHESVETMVLADVAEMDLSDLNQAIARCQGCNAVPQLTLTRAASGAQIRLLLVDYQDSGIDRLEQGLLPGDSGRMLDQILFALGLKREQVRLLRVARGQDAKLDAGVLTECSPFIAREIEIVAPVVIAALGSASADVLQRYVKPSVPVVMLTHPSILLGDAKAKRAMWSSLRGLHVRLFDAPSAKA